MKSTPLPPEFAPLQGQVAYVQQTGPTEFHSSCPRCGDEGHVGIDWPDRFVMFVAGPQSRGWCRRCGYFVWANKLAGGPEPSWEQIEKFRKERMAAEEARKRSAERALRLLRDSHLWEKYHDDMPEVGVKYWQDAGLAEAWQAYWGLGWKTGWQFRQPDNSLFVTPSATIPIFSPDDVLVNVKHRLIHPPRGRGKYLYEIHGQPAPLFICNRGVPLGGDILVVEGEKKAMVAFATLDDVDALVVGLPGATPPQAALDQLSDAERITLVMDPGAEEQGHKLVTRLGRKRTRLLVPPMKLDDAIIAMNISKLELRTLLQQAERI